MRTLFVEDNDPQREEGERWLAELGLEVTAVADANAGLLAHLREPFDLMVIDWVMPGMDGLTLCHRIRAMPGGENPYILVVTARDRPADLVEALDAGANDYIAKPMDYDLLRTRIRIAERTVASSALHREAIQQLAQSEVDFRRVIERSPLGVFAHRDGKIIYINAAALRTFGVERDRVIGASLAAFVPTEYRDVARKRAARFERTDAAPPPIEMELERAGGERAVVRVIPATRAIYKGERAAFTILEDITERQRAERELRLTQFAMDHASDAAFWVRYGGRISYVNHSACALTGYGRDELIGMPIVDLDAALDDEQWQHLRLALFSQRKVQRDGRLRRRDGAPVPVEISAGGLEFDGERFVVAFARDLREREQMQKSLQKADRLASVGSLAAGVAHEINNPLAYIIANLELVSEDLVRIESGEQAPALAELRRTLQEATEGAHRVRRIVGDLKSFARADDDDSHAVDICDVLDTAIDIAGNEIRHRAHLERKYSETPLAWGNEGRLTQVFLNLLLNAAHAIPEDGREDHRVDVTATSDSQGWIVIEIADTGVGIEAEIIDRIFDPFFTTKPHGMGTGLGLSICHGIVTSLGGKIEVASEMGEGSRFRVRLPPAEPRVIDIARQRRSQVPAGVGRKLRILVVDDEPLICEGIRRALAGHEVEVAASGRDAIRKCQDGDFDLILCDVMMPDVSGMEVYGRIRTARPGVEGRFVFMTGGAFTPKTREFLESVDNEQIIKPFSLRELRTLVAKRAAGE